MTKTGRRLLGRFEDGKALYEPKPSHSLMLAAAGGGKTTAGAMTWILSMLADARRGMVIMDSKDGEIFAQIEPICDIYGRTLRLIDNTGVFGDHPKRVQLNSFGGVVAADKRGSGELLFSCENATNALIEEPPGDAKNYYWRSEPRKLIEFAQRALLKRNPDLATPGGVWSLLSDPEVLSDALLIEAEEGDEALRSRARNLTALREDNPEHWSQHLGAALDSLRIFEAGSMLHQAGRDARMTHLDLLQSNDVICIVGPQRHMDRLGASYALELQSFLEAQLTGLAGATDFILDEFTNAPLKTLVSKLTTMRAYGGRCHMIAQSRSEIQRKYGEKEAITIDENAIVKQWLGFSSFDEAQRVSKAMGEVSNIDHNLGVGTEKLDISATWQRGREPLMTPEELMRLPSDEQIIHVKDIGFIHCKKVRQNEIAPYCNELGDNPLEGGRLPPDPKVTLPTAMEDE